MTAITFEDVPGQPNARRLVAPAKIRRRRRRPGCLQTGGVVILVLGVLTFLGSVVFMVLGGP